MQEKERTDEWKFFCAVSNNIVKVGLKRVMVYVETYTTQK
jgi:hypothetical protein